MAAVRSVLFWIHLVAGVIGSVLILTMSATGVLLAFQPQMLEWLERDQRQVEVPAHARRLEPSVLIAAATSGRDRLDQATLTLSSDPHLSAVVSFGREGLRYVNPYTGVVLGEGAPTARAAFQWLIEFHRWLAVEPASRPAVRIGTGGSSLLFALLALSGLVLWWPRRVSIGSLARAATPRWVGTTTARHFNWHTVIGFWCAPVIVVLALSGAVLSFPWANRLLHAAAGTPLPAPTAAPRPPHSGAAQPVTARTGAAAPVDYARLDPLWRLAEQQVPSWGTIAMRIPTRMEGPLSFTITDAAHWNRFARSQLTVSLATGAVARWEPYAQQTRGQRWRGWARFAHTGELGGLTGQLVAAAASAGGVLLVWTGLSLAVRRLGRWRERRPVSFARAA